MQHRVAIRQARCAHRQMFSLAKETNFEDHAQARRPESYSALIWLGMCTSLHLAIWLVAIEHDKFSYWHCCEVNISKAGKEHSDKDLKWWIVRVKTMHIAGRAFCSHCNIARGVRTVHKCRMGTSFECSQRCHFAGYCHLSGRAAPMACLQV